MSAESAFNPRLVAGLVAAGILAFIAMMLLIAYGGQPVAGREGRAGPTSVAATGFRALMALTSEYYDTALVDDPEEERDDLLVFAYQERTLPHQVADLLERRRNLPTLIILPKWMTYPDPDHRGWVRALGPDVGDVAERAFGGIDVAVQPAGRPRAAAVEGSGLLSGLRLAVPASAQTVTGKTLTPLAALPGGGALVAQIGEEPHYILADPDLANNQGLRDPERARAALRLIRRINPGGESVDFDAATSATGGGSSKTPSVLRLAFEPPFLVMTLALFFAALLAGLHGAFRFGPVVAEARSIALGKSALVENSAGLIRLAERETRLGAAYADVVRQDTARLTGAPAWLQGADLDRYLDRLGRAGAPAFSELAASLLAARDRHGLMAAARALHQWKKEIIR